MMLNGLLKILLPKGILERDARSQDSLKIKPRFTDGGFRRLFILLFVTLFLLGYQPSINFYPLKQSVVFAESSPLPEVSQTITKQELPIMTLPLAGYLSTNFSWYHPGIDIATGYGTPIHPIADGVVTEVNSFVVGYGHHVVITHSDSVTSLYGHMDKMFVSVGQKVTTGDVIGTVGLTGFTTGPHVHLEIHQNGIAINPTPILPPIQNYPSAEFLRPFGGNTPNEPSNIVPTNTQIYTPTPAPTIQPAAVFKPVTSIIPQIISPTPAPTGTDLHKTLKPIF